MFDRSSQYSSMRQFAHLHPGYATALTTLSAAAPFVLGPLFLPAPVFSYYLGKELWNEFKHIKDPFHQIASIYENTQVKKGPLVIGELRHYNKMPLVQLNTNDEHLNSEALATLLARNYLDFYTEYFWYLFAIARVGHGPLGKDAIQFINEEIRRRGGR